jgi:hypothetical protein
MKRIPLTIICLIVYTFVFSQSQNEEKDRIHYANTKIAKSTQWTYKYTKGKLNASGYITTESKYDEKGNVIEVINYKSTGQISSKLLYKYDEKNNRTEYQKFQKLNKPDIELSFKQSFTYDEKGNKKLEVGFDGLNNYRIEYNYLPDGKTKNIIKYNADNSIAEKWESSYNGNIQTINVLKRGTTLDYTLIRKTDSKNNLVEEIRNDAKGKEQSRVTTEYDGNNNVTATAEYYSGKLSKKYTYVYNKKNLLTEIYLISTEGNKTLYKAYKYDEKENVIEEKWYDGIPDDLSSKNFKYNEKSFPSEVESYYSDYKYKVLYKYTYEYRK